MNKKRQHSERTTTEEESVRTILIAEDDEGLAQLIDKRLRREGFSTVRTSNGTETIAWLSDHPHTLLLVDYRLSDMTGKEVVETLMEGDLKVPFVVITGQGDEKIAVEMMKLGARDYLIKEEGFLDLVPSIVKCVVAEIATEEELAEAQRALRESEDKYRNLVERANDGIAIIQKGVFRYVNRHLAERAGCAPEELVGTSFADLIHPDDVSKVIDYYNRRMAGEDVPTTYELAIRRRDGIKVHLEVNGGVITYQGEVADLVIVRDLAERNRAQEELQQSEEKYRTLFELAPYGIVTMDMKGVITSMNRAIEKFSGWSREDIVGKHFTKLGAVRAKDMAKHRRLFRRAVRGEIPGPFETIFRRKDGSQGHVEVHAGLLEVAGEKLGLQILVKDITERRRAEEAIEALVESMVGTSGQECFDKVVTELCNWLGADCAIVGRIVDHTSVQVLSMQVNGEKRRDYTYLLKGTPCEQVAKKGYCVYPEDAYRLFPKAEDLVGLKAEGYVGTPVLGKDGRPIGILCVMSRKKLALPERVSELMSVIATRVASELERLQAEETLRLTQFAIDHAGEAAYWMDSQARFTYVNEAACNSLGYTKEELLSLRVFDISPGLSKDMWGKMWAELRKRGSVTREIVHRRKDGQEVAVEVTANHVTFSGQEFNCSFARDISERKRAEEEIRKSEELYRTIVETSHDLIWRTDRKGIFTFVNRRSAEVTGSGVKRTIGTDAARFIHPDDLPLAREHFLKVTHEGRVETCELRIKSRKGGYIVLEVTEVPIIEGEKVVGVMAFGSDITERKQSEEALRVSQEYSRNIVDSSLDMIIAVDTERRITEFNQAAEEAFGYQAKEVLGKHVNLLYADADEGLHVHRATLEKQRHVQEIMNRRKTGDVFPSLLSASVLRDRSGRVIGVMGISRDITERKEAEEALRSAEARYRRLFNEAPVMYVITGAEEGEPIVKDCNNLFLSTVGYKRAEVVGRPLSDFYTEASRKLLLNGGYDRVLEGEFTEEERQLVTRDGRIVETLLHAVPEKDSRGTVVGTRAMYTDITERKRDARALEESEERYRTLIDSAPISIAVHQDGKLVMVNRATVKQLGYKDEKELLGKPVLETFHPDSRESAARMIEEMEKTGRPASPTEGKVLKKNGSVAYVLVSSAPIVFGGKPAFQMTSADITALRMAEKALAESEERYRKVVESATDIIFQHNIEGNFTFLNPVATRVTEYSEEELLGMNYATLVHPDDVDRIRRFFEKQFKEGRKEGDYECRIVTKGGDAVWIRATVTVLMEGERIVGWQSIARDVTDRKRAEEAVKRSEQNYRELFDSVTDAIFIHDRDGRFIDVNPAAMKMTGYSREELVAGTPEMVTDADKVDPTSVKALINAAFAGEVQHFESWGKRKSGESFPDEVILAKTAYDGKEAVIASIRDITDKKEAERKLQDRLDELERFQKATVGRELRMIELKKRIRELEEQIEGKKES